MSQISSKDLYMKKLCQDGTKNPIGVKKKMGRQEVCSKLSARLL
jgi:hypothetical protein